MKLAVQLIDLGFRTFESFLPGCGHLVNATFSFMDDLDIGTEKACAFHSMQQWIKCAWSDAVAVMPKLLHHRKAEDVLVRRVDEDMNSNQTGKKFPLMFEHIMNIPS